MMTTEQPLKLLIVEDSPDDAELMVLELRRTGQVVNYQCVETEADYARQLSYTPDVILCDYSLPQFGAIRALEILQELGLDTPLIVITGAIGDEAAAQCIGYGASDYILKDRLGRLSQAVDQIMDKKRMRNLDRCLHVELVEAQKLESAGRLAGGIAHDFNNMLTAIMGFSELMTLRCTLEPKATSYLNYITLAAEKAHKLCQQLLAFSGRQHVEPKSVDLNSLIHGIELILRPLMGERIQLTIRLEPKLNTVLVDPGQFEQILVNLVENSREAINGVGEIIIETQNQCLDSAYDVRDESITTGEYVVLTVTDTGAGMDEATRAHVFEPFSTGKQRGGRVGLALASAYGIVQQAKGHISVESSPDSGAAFKIFLPRAAQPVQRAQHAQQEPHISNVALMSGSETILLAEGEPAVRALAAVTLRGLGYSVVDAADEEARVLALDGTDEIDLYITGGELVNSGGTGLEDWLRTRNPHLKVLFISESTSRKDGHSAGYYGAANTITRPFTPTVLARKVREALNPQSAGH